MTLTELKEKNPKWFSHGNKKLFNDVSYRVLHGKRTGEPYLVRSTYAWTEMFGVERRRLHWRINRIKDDGTIGYLVDGEFSTIWGAKGWLKTEPGEEVKNATSKEDPAQHDPCDQGPSQAG